MINDGTLKVIGSEIDKEYLAEVKKVTVDPELVAEEGKTMKLIFTPLHGTGAMLGEKALRQGVLRISLWFPNKRLRMPIFQP